MCGDIRDYRYIQHISQLLVQLKHLLYFFRFGSEDDVKKSGTVHGAAFASSGGGGGAVKNSGSSTSVKYSTSTHSFSAG